MRETIPVDIAEKDNSTEELIYTKEPFVKVVKFDVTDVIYSSLNISFTPMSEAIIGGNRPSPVYQGGYQSKVVITVDPMDSYIPTTTLEYLGDTIVQAGYSIEAKVALCKQVGEYQNVSLFDITKPPVHFIERKLGEVEKPLEMRVFDAQGDYLRTERSVLYGDVFRE